MLSDFGNAENAYRMSLTQEQDPDRLMDTGKLLVANKHFEAARACFNKILSLKKASVPLTEEARGSLRKIPHTDK
ncbi:MAG: hypothetical protein ACRD3W_25270 [Terriglobales bacterium]